MTLTAIEMMVTATAAAGVTYPGPLVPPTRNDGETVILPITVPDGRRVELRYPRSMRLAQGGFRTLGAVEWSVRPDPLRCCGRVLYIDHATIADTYGSAIPVAQYRGARDRTVWYFHAEQAIGGGLTTLDYLVFEFGPWTVSVYNHAPADFEDEMSDEELATWARSLDGFVDKRGFLVLRAEPPLEIEPLIGFTFGASGAGSNVLEVAEERCDSAESDTTKRRHFPGGVAWCDPDTHLHISAEGDPGFVRKAARHLEIRFLEEISSLSGK